MRIFFEFFDSAFFYFAIYFWLFTITVLEICLPIDRRTKFLAAKASLIGLTLILGLRWETGTDWSPYFELFKSIEINTNALLAIYGFDLGYVFLNAFVRLFSDNYTVFLLINSALAISLIYKFIRLSSPFPNTSILIFYVSYFVPHFMGSNRRVIAIGFVLLVFIRARVFRLFNTATLLTLAMSFHRSSVATILGLLVPDRHFSRKQIVILLGTCVALGASFELADEIKKLGEILAQYTDFEIVEKMIFYGETSDEHGSENVDVFTQTTLALLKRSIFLILFFLTIRKVKDSGIHARLLNLYIVGTAIYILFSGAPIFRVLSNYFSAVEIALIGICAANMSPNKRPYLAIFLFLYGIFQLISALTPYPELYLPYISIFSDVKRLTNY